MKDRSYLMCPSSNCKTGSDILGVRQDNGMVAILPQTLPINDAFIEKTTAHPISVQQRFRFTNKCIENGCRQWNGKGCGVIETVVRYLDKVPQIQNLQPCSIRPTCRWFSQRGSDACRICPYITTELTEIT